MTDDDEERKGEVLTVGKKNKEESLDKGKEGKKEPEESGDVTPRAQPAQPAQSYPPQGYYPPPQPLFTSGSLQRLLAVGILICVIMLFVGSMLTAGGMYVKTEDSGARDLKRNLAASGVLLGAIGLFLLGLFATLAFMQIHDLSDQQKQGILILMAAIFIGFAMLINTIAVL